MITPFKNIVQTQRNEKRYIDKKLKDMQLNTHLINKYSDKKILTIIACHSDSLLKYNTILNNIKYFNFTNNHIILVTSKDEKYSKNVKEKIKEMNLYRLISYFEIPNDSHLDIGKWCHALSRINLHFYDFVVFTNDSFVITSSILHFYNRMINTNVELYGYNDSTQIKYHYQSYLFGVKKEAVNKLVDLYISKKKILLSYEEVVNNIELKLVETFSTKDCFLKIGDLGEIGLNIFFNNDNLYQKLLSTRLLPFIKVKRLLNKKENNEINETNQINQYENLNEDKEIIQPTEQKKNNTLSDINFMRNNNFINETVINNISKKKENNTVIIVINNFNV